MAHREEISIPSEPLENRQSPSGVTNIGENISLEGTIRANEDILIDGTLKGTIEVNSHRLTVGPKGKIDADVVAEDVLISGRMSGSITARNLVHIAKSADFIGQVKARRIIIEDGAFVKASIELEKEEKEKATALTGKPVESMLFNQNSHNPKIKKPEIPEKQVSA
jgi:cytoskeletal protein CcmA (bactofilin family)